MRRRRGTVGACQLLSLLLSALAVGAARAFLAEDEQWRESAQLQEFSAGRDGKQTSERSIDENQIDYERFEAHKYFIFLIFWTKNIFTHCRKSAFSQHLQFGIALRNSGDVDMRHSRRRSVLQAYGTCLSSASSMRHLPRRQSHQTPSDRIRDRRHPTMVAKSNALGLLPPGSPAKSLARLQNGLSYDRVNITIDLRQEYQVAYVIVKAGISPRPGKCAAFFALYNQTIHLIYSQ